MTHSSESTCKNYCMLGKSLVCS